jgi:predicted transcriptional regulator of viral defense system
MPRKLGQLENAAFAFAQMRNLRTVRVGDLVSGLRISAKQERELLSRMARSGMIANVRKGLYLVPPRLPLGGIWTPDEATAINTLMADKNARYQITGPKAFNRYGYSEQLPSITTLYNDAISGERLCRERRDQTHQGRPRQARQCRESPYAIRRDACLLVTPPHAR